MPDDFRALLLSALLLPALKTGKLFPDVLLDHLLDAADEAQQAWRFQ
jgi:hypothetical protein